MTTKKVNYYIEYNRATKNDYTDSLKKAIKKGYDYLNAHPYSQSVLNIFKYTGSAGTFSAWDTSRNVGTMYWSKVKGKKRIVFDSSNAPSGYNNLVYSDGRIGEKVWYDTRRV